MENAKWVQFKSKQKYFTFSDIEKSFLDQKNKSVETLMNLDRTITWDRIETILMRDYPVGHKKEEVKINEGIALDARVVKPASRPMSNKKLGELKAKRETPEGKLDKNGKPLKFFKDIESNWVTKSDKHGNTYFY